MTKQESDKLMEMYWDGAITAIEISLHFINDDLNRYECGRFRRFFINIACWLLSKADFMHR